MFLVKVNNIIIIGMCSFVCDVSRNVAMTTNYQTGDVVLTGSQHTEIVCKNHSVYSASSESGKFSSRLSLSILVLDIFYYDWNVRNSSYKCVFIQQTKIIK